MWGVSLTHPMLAFFFFSFINLVSFSGTSRAGFIFMRGVSLTNPVLALFLSGEFLLHIPCLLFISVGSLSYTSLAGFSSPLSLLSWLHFYAGSFSYTSRAFFVFFFFLVFFFVWGVSFTHPALALFFGGEFLLHIPCLFDFSVGSFSYTSRAGFIFMRGVSLKHPVLALFLCGEFLLHVPCLLFISVGSLSYTSLVGFSPSLSLLSWLHFLRGVSLTHPVLASFLISGVSLTHPMLALFLSGKFFWHLPCCLYISIYLSIYLSKIWGVSLTHPVLALFLSGDLLLDIPCSVHYYAGSFSYTSGAGFIFI